jgi:hypothetical protein
MNLTEYLNDLGMSRGGSLRAWRTGGWPAVLDEARTRTVDRVGGFVRRFVIETDLSRLADPAVPEEVEIRIFNGPDWSLLGDMGRSRLIPQLDQAVADGRICLVAWKRRQAVGYAWFSPSVESRHESYDLPLPPDTIYVWQVEVARSEPNPGVAAALLTCGLRIWRDRGFQRSWIILHPGNVASLSTIASVAPSRVLGTVARLKVFSWVRSWYRALSAPVPIQAWLTR